MPKPYPREFRDDVVRVARAREAGVTPAQVAKDFGVHEMTLDKWLRQADVDEGHKPGATTSESVELRELKRGTVAGAENEVLRRATYLSPANLPQNDLPARPRVGRKGTRSGCL